MSPPKKSTTSKSSPKKSGSSGTKKAATKSAPRKKTAKKKKKGGRGKGILLAFVAGLVLASAAFWFLRDASLPWNAPAGKPAKLAAAPKKQAAPGTVKKQEQSAAQKAAQQQKDKAAAAAKKPTKTAPPADKAAETKKGRGADKNAPSLLPKNSERGAITDPIVADKSRKPEQAASPAQGAAPSQPPSAQSTQPPTAPPVQPPTAPSIQPPTAASPQPPQAAGGPTAGGSGADKAPAVPKAPKGNEAAVASALQDLQSLAYEEDIAVLPLADRIRQVDYALMQAAWIRKLPASAMRLALVEEKTRGKEQYRLQQVEVLPGSDSGHYIDALKDCLALWAEGASVAPASSNTWVISLGGAATHRLRLYPGKTAFPTPANVATPPQAAKTVPPPVPGVEKPKLRAEGEAPKLVIVIDDLGASAAATKALLELNYPVTFAFWPHGAHTREGAVQAHARGMEVLIHQPMEPLGYPKVKPGPNVLLTGMDESRVRGILDASIRAVPHAVGLNNHMGSRFTQDKAGTRAVSRLLKERGLFMLDSLTHSASVFRQEAKKVGLENYCRHVFLDVTHSRSKILEQLRRAERIAIFTGQAVAIGHPLPETLAALRDWQKMRSGKVRIVRLRDLRQE